MLCALVPIAAAWRTLPTGVLVACLALAVLAGGAANRLSALLRPPDLEPVRLAGVPGIRVPPSEAEALPRKRGRPSGSRALDEYLADAYVPAGRFGAYEVLVPR